MASLTARGRVLVVMAFLVSASLFAGAAVALVMATNDDDGKKVSAVPTIKPTLVFPSEQPTQAPSATASPTATPTPTATVAPKPTPAATATPAATSSPAPRRTSTPRPSPTTVQGLSASAAINYATGGTTAQEFKITARAFDGDGSISLQSLDWGDGSELVKGGRGTACSPPATAPADCRTFAWTHEFASAGSYIVTVAFVSGKETSILHLTVKVDPAP